MSKMDETLLTPVGLLDLLSQIDELQQFELGLTETPDGLLQLQVGESLYELDDSNAVDIPVTEDVVEDLESINDTAYDDLVSRADLDVSDDSGLESVESGIIKELAKTLLIGGMVRMAAKTLKN